MKDKITSIVILARCMVGLAGGAVNAKMGEIFDCSQFKGYDSKSEKPPVEVAFLISSKLALPATEANVELVAKLKKSKAEIDEAQRAIHDQLQSRAMQMQTGGNVDAVAIGEALSASINPLMESIQKLIELQGSSTAIQAELLSVSLIDQGKVLADTLVPALSELMHGVMESNSAALRQVLEESAANNAKIVAAVTDNALAGAKTSKK